MSYVLSAVIGIIIGVASAFSPPPADTPKQDSTQQERKEK